MPPAVLPCQRTSEFIKEKLKCLNVVMPANEASYSLQSLRCFLRQNDDTLFLNYTSFIQYIIAVKVK